MRLSVIWHNIFRGRKKGEDRIIDFLRAVPIFAELTESELRILEQNVYLRRYTDGEPVFKEGDPSLGMYVVKGGAVDIVRQVRADQPMCLATLTPGDFFGELGLIDDAPRSASAVARGATEAIGFFKPDLMRLVHQKPDFGLKIFLSVAKTVSARLRRADEELDPHLVKHRGESRAPATGEGERRAP